MLYLVMGVTGSGKSTVAAALAEELRLPFYDADAFHGPESRAKMERDEPLNDSDRAPWLARIAAHVPRWEARGGAVLACSALKETYRRTIRNDARNMQVIFLQASPEVVRARLAARRGRHAIVDRFDAIVDGQFRDLEPPREGLVVLATKPVHEIVGTIISAVAITAERAMLRIEDGGRDRIIDDAEADAHIASLVEGFRLRQGSRVLLLPPDYTRRSSGAGELTASLYARLIERGAKVEIMPATGTHVSMSTEEIAEMFAGVPASANAFVRHDFQHELSRLGEVPGAFVADISEGRVDYAIRCEVAARLTTGRWDRIVSIGQLVPHEVAGIANHAKNVFVGAGGKDVIDKTHFLGAVCGMERIMGCIQSPVREVLSFMGAEFAAALPPITYLLTVRERLAGRKCRVVTRGLYAGDDERCYFAGAKLAREVNVTWLDRPLHKVVVQLDAREFKSTWLGNKAIYRTRMALADGAELVVLAPGIERFGEDPTIDRLVRRHGYRGTPAVLEAVRSDPELAGSLSAAAHLIHGSSEGRFTITYATNATLPGDTVRGVGFNHLDYAAAVHRYDPASLVDGWNRVVGGEDVFFVSHPSSGLWACAQRTGARER